MNPDIKAKLDARRAAERKPPASSEAAAPEAAPVKKKKNRHAKKQERKRTAKVVLDWRGVEQQRESYWAGAIEAGAKATGNPEVMTSKQSESLITSLPFSSLAECFLYQNDGLVQGRCAQIVGLPGSAKSLYLYWVLRQVMDYGGLTTLFPNEGKDSPDLRHSVYGHRASYRDRTAIHPCHSLEDWMEGLTWWVSKIYRDCDPSGQFPALARKAKKKKKANDIDDEDILDDLLATIDNSPLPDKAVRAKNPGFNWQIPFAMGVDSLMATEARAVIENIMQKGSSERGFAISALLLSTYCKTLPLWLGNNPISVFGTNHMKPAKDERGFTTYNVPGGWAFKFMETWRIQMDKISGVRRGGYGGIRVRMKTAKNSLGETGSSIVANVLWKRVEVADGRFKQYTFWDWPSATVELLLSLKDKKYGNTIVRRVRDVVDLNPMSKNRVWSKALGGTKSSPLSYHQAGILIDNDLEMRQAIYPLLDIAERKRFEPGIAYADKFEAQRQEAYERAKRKGGVGRNFEDLVMIDNVLSTRANARGNKGKTDGATITDGGDEELE